MFGDRQLRAELAALRRRVEALEERLELGGPPAGQAFPSSEPSYPQPFPSQSPAATNAGVSDQVLMLIDRGQVIHAIKRVQEETGLGLADAKRVVDGLRDRR